MYMYNVHVYLGTNESNNHHLYVEINIADIIPNESSWQDLKKFRALRMYIIIASASCYVYYVQSCIGIAATVTLYSTLFI